MSKILDIAGQKFGKVIAIKSTKKRNCGAAIWVCKCECGNEVKLCARYLKQTGKFPSCGKGCMTKGKKPRESEVNWRQSAHKIYSQYKSKSKKRKLDFDLSFDEAMILFKGNCFYCNQVPSNIRDVRNSKFTYNGIDRQDNSKGYILNNCVTCCRICNSAKNNLTMEQFKDWIDRIYSWRIQL